MSTKKQVPPQKELVDLYSKEGSTISSLAKHYNTSNPTIRKWLIQYGIERKTHAQASMEANNRHRKANIPSKEEIESIYKSNSIKFIEKYYCVSQQTVYEWLFLYDIDLKDFNTACEDGKRIQHEAINFSKEYLDSVYDRSKPIQFLADKLGVSYSYTKKILKQNEIEVPISWRSKAEIYLFEHCKKKYSGEWISNSKSLIGPYEIDIYNKENNLAIEYCGNVWHSENFGGKKSGYHQKKIIMCNDLGIKLITVFESDDKHKILKLLDTLNHNNERLYARNTTIRRLNSKDARIFHDEHHIHGFVPANFHYGLFYNEKLVMACSFGKSRFNKKYIYECARMTSHSDFTVVGGASKLFSHFKKDQTPESIITYADLRIGNGKVYEKCGFDFQGYSPPNYWYFHKSNPTKLFSRVSFQKHKLEKKLEIFDSSKTEFENMVSNGWDRIWDCGSAIYTWTKKEGQ